MRSRLKPLVPLAGEQLRASSPSDHAALSASAGTGKTHVLTARVLRLLLSGVDPSAILCLTFTKAGAAEMAHRIQERLAYWVRLKDTELGRELAALGEDPGPERRDHARTLFARVLDAPGGGLRIQTIHAFAQSLLGAFPAEAGLVPGFRPLEGREEQLLARRTLAGLLVTAEREGDLGLIVDMQALSHRLGEGGAEDFLMRCARAPAAMEALGPRSGIEARLRRAFDLPLGDIEEEIVAGCGDDVFDVAGLRQIGLLNAGWKSKNGAERASLCERWLDGSPAERATLLEDLHLVWAKKDGEVRSFGKGQAPQDDGYAELAAAAFDCCRRLIGLRRRARLVASFGAGLRAGQTFALAYADAKRASGLVDFDDLIRRAEELLTTPGMGDWVRYKLDQSTDHILVDEAQDTNERQWNIVGALTEEFFTGMGSGRSYRTIFTVGDFKQAIFGFQGTDPREFERTREYFQAKANAVRDAAESIDMPGWAVPPSFLDLSMDRSFRSAPEVLALVDRIVADLGHERLGLPRPPRPHEAHHGKRAGSVVLWQPYSEEGDDTEDAGEEGWVSDTVRRYAARLARQIKAWLHSPFYVEAKKRALRPEDILILVRRRSTLAALIVARLHAEGVPVAGVDRLLLSAPLAVQDLLAAARFAVQPLDDLNLAALLVSPLIGWSQDQLFEAAHGRNGSLWEQVRGQCGPLNELLATVDYTTPHQFFETILSGPLQGRRKLLERLGPEARDPIEELVAGALDFETKGAASLQRFLDWFARGDVEIVRDPSAPLDAVRVMTAHGSKGLQAPVVILADACVDPERSRGGSVTLSMDGAQVPLFRPRKEELAEPLASQLAEQERREAEEHWRLLYVALTRAEERLYIGGALGAADRNGPSERSWHAAADVSLAGLGCEWTDDPFWGSARRLGSVEVPARHAAPTANRAALPLPAWLHAPAPVEARPPRPLAPSAIGDDEVADAPPSPAMREAAQRGKLLHRLFESLPAVAAEEREAKADRWLQMSAGVSDGALRAAIVRDACRVISDPRFAALFGPGSLAEAPIAAVVGSGTVVSGTVDRLLVTNDRVILADFKTDRRPPRDESAIPVPHLRQMAAYVAALRVIFPGRAVEASLLYTSGPVPYPLSDPLLAPYLPA